MQKNLVTKAVGIIVILIFFLYGIFGIPKGLPTRNAGAKCALDTAGPICVICLWPVSPWQGC